MQHLLVVDWTLSLARFERSDTAELCAAVVAHNHPADNFDKTAAPGNDSTDNQLPMGQLGTDPIDCLDCLDCLNDSPL